MKPEDLMGFTTAPLDGKYLITVRTIDQDSKETLVSSKIVELKAGDKIPWDLVSEDHTFLGE